MYYKSDHIQSKLIRIQWQVGTDQSHIKYIQGQIRLIQIPIRLISYYTCRFLSFSGSISLSRPKPLIKSLYQLHFMIRGRPFNSFSYGFIKFRFQKCRDLNPRLDPVGGSKPNSGLLRHFQLSSQNILFGLFHFRLFNYLEALHFGQARNIYKSFIISQHAFSMQ